MNAFTSVDDVTHAHASLTDAPVTLLDASTSLTDASVKLARPPVEAIDVRIAQGVTRG